MSSHCCTWQIRYMLICKALINTKPQQKKHYGTFKIDWLRSLTRIIFEEQCPSDSVMPNVTPWCVNCIGGAVYRIFSSAKNKWLKSFSWGWISESLLQGGVFLDHWRETGRRGEEIPTQDYNNCGLKWRDNTGEQGPALKVCSTCEGSFPAAPVNKILWVKWQNGWRFGVDSIKKRWISKRLVDFSPINVKLLSYKTFIITLAFAFIIMLRYVHSFWPAKSSQCAYSVIRIMELGTRSE